MSRVNCPEKEQLLECEKLWVFIVLILVGGYLGAYTYSVRGGVFCNAQTANVVLLCQALGNGKWFKALYYLIPISAYLLGAILSELLPNPLKRFQLIRWDTLLLGIEASVLIILGFIPDSWPFQISQVAINFICSMQYNTFRQAEHIPMATTFCTNHIRQTGVFLTKWLHHKDDTMLRRRFLIHVSMLFAFMVGGIVSTLLCSVFFGKAVWGAAFILILLFIYFVYVDLTKEKDLIFLKPAGH